MFAPYEVWPIVDIKPIVIISLQSAQDNLVLIKNQNCKYQ